LNSFSLLLATCLELILVVMMRPLYLS
jgi:hypothetical protein